jgi:hypothetical protein
MYQTVDNKFGPLHMSPTVNQSNFKGQWEANVFSIQILILSNVDLMKAAFKVQQYCSSISFHRWNITPDCHSQ